MEIGNYLFGNSRGNFPFPDRDIANSKEWTNLLKAINADMYGCTNSLNENEYMLRKNNEIIFSIMPYYWGDCTCGVEEKNAKLYDKLIDECFTKEEKKIYTSYTDICDIDCPAFCYDDMPDEELVKICKCGCVKKNIVLKNKKEAIKDKIKNFEERYNKEQLDHDESCLLVQHNFVYHPGKEDEFWIEWYKYPFRDSYMNKNLSIKEILEIFQDCINQEKSK